MKTVVNLQEEQVQAMLEQEQVQAMLEQEQVQAMLEQEQVQAMLEQEQVQAMLDNELYNLYKMNKDDDKIGYAFWTMQGRKNKKLQTLLDDTSMLYHEKKLIYASYAITKRALNTIIAKQQGNIVNNTSSFNKIEYIRNNLYRALVYSYSNKIDDIIHCNNLTDALDIFNACATELSNTGKPRLIKRAFSACNKTVYQYKSLDSKATAHHIISIDKAREDGIILGIAQDKGLTLDILLEEVKMSIIQKRILELLVIGYRQVNIAKELNMSTMQVSRQVKIIRTIVSNYIRR